MYFYFWVCFISFYFSRSVCPFQFRVKSSCFQHSFLFFSHSHTVRKKSASLQSREFRFVCVCVCVCIMEWVCGYGERKKQRKRFVLFNLFVFLYFFCWDVLLCFTLLSNKSHSFSWTWHLELYFLSLITFIISYQ